MALLKHQFLESWQRIGIKHNSIAVLAVVSMSWSIVLLKKKSAFNIYRDVYSAL